MRALAACIEQAIREQRAGFVETTVFDTSDPRGIATQLDALCRDHLGASIAEPLFYTSSVGCVAGLRLADGADVVVKAFQPRWTRRFLTGVRRAQSTLATGGFPCPHPLAGPLHVGLGLALVTSHLADPGQGPVTRGSARVSARGLAEQIRALRRLDWSHGPRHPLRTTGDALYPEPHSPLFDFEATAAGAEWIDDLARAAKEVRDARRGRHVVAHTDWALRNVRLGRDRVLAAYDWDSLAWVDEVVAVGQAAATWSASHGAEPAPTALAIARYAAAYDKRRGGRRFGDRAVTAIGASALYVLAYAARCEHAVDPEARRFARARPRIRRDAANLLRLADLMQR